MGCGRRSSIERERKEQKEREAIEMQRNGKRGRCSSYSTFSNRFYFWSRYFQLSLYCFSTASFYKHAACILLQLTAQIFILGWRCCAVLNIYAAYLIFSKCMPTENLYRAHIRMFGQFSYLNIFFIGIYFVDFKIVQCQKRELDHHTPHSQYVGMCKQSQ